MFRAFSTIVNFFGYNSSPSKLEVEFLRQHLTSYFISTYSLEVKITQTRSPSKVVCQHSDHAWVQGELNIG